MTLALSNDCRVSCTMHFERNPLRIEKASKQYLYDEHGQEYLDCVNSTAHVGHSHPQVISTGQCQMAKLTSCQGFLNDTVAKYIKALVETLPDRLSVCYLVNSGSEANDLALRLARQYTKQEDVVVLDSAYHGNLTTLVDISPYLFKRLPSGKKEYVHVLPAPNRTLERFDGPEADSEEDISNARRLLDNVQNSGRQIACFFSEILLVNSGVIVPSKTYYKNVYSLIRERGGICVADEVQTGLGRTGDYFWAFQTYDLNPDIVTMGKPLGNGHPLAAVVTTREIADSLGEFLTTFGGNPVACSMGLAVLDVIRNEKLMSAAKMVGRILVEGFKDIRNRHACIGTVRGMGLCIGVDLVTDRASMKPAYNMADSLIYSMKEEKIVMGLAPASKSTLLITPPLCFTVENARRMLRVFEHVLGKIENGVVPEKPSITGIANIPSDFMTWNDSNSNRFGEQQESDMDEESRGPVKRQKLYEDMD